MSEPTEDATSVPPILCEETRAWLEHMCREDGGPLHPKSARSTVALYRGDQGARARVRQSLVDRYLGRVDAATIERGGRYAVYTAGPPGVGKSTYLEGQLDVATYREIDADYFKDLLLRQALSDGVFDHLLQTVLPDGKTLAPRELAGLVHTESTMLAEQMRDRCMRLGENVVVHGTMQWSDYPQLAMGHLLKHDYRHLDVISVEAPLELVLKRARERWWSGRHEAGLGGRFTPEQMIRSLYDDRQTEHSRCRNHAATLVSRAAANGLTAELSPIDYGSWPAGDVEASGPR